MTLEEYRITKGLTLTQLAARLGFGISTVHGWLHDAARQPSAAAVQLIVERTKGEVTAAELRHDLAAAARAEAAGRKARALA